MTSVPHPRLLRAALAACVALLAGACAPAGPSAGPAPQVEAETQLGPAAWTAQSPARDIADWVRTGCQRARGGKDACLERTLVALIDDAGIAKSMEVLDTLATLDGDIKTNAHPLAHGMGIAAYRGQESMAATFAACPVTQMSGCGHGVIQGYFLDLSRQGHTIGKAELDAVCNPHRDNQFTYFQCAHGLGHGLMAVHENHLPMSLESCDLASDDFIRMSCYGGAFMENIVNATHPHHSAGGHASTQGGHGGHGQVASADEHAGHGQTAQPAPAPAADEHAGHDAHAGHQAAGQTAPAAQGEHANHDAQGQQAPAGQATQDAHAGHGAPVAQQAMNHGDWRALDRNDWLYPCNAVALKYQDACYAMQTSAVMFFNYGDVGSTARVCERAPEQFHVTCFMSLGRDITAFASQDHRRTIDMCQRVGDAGAGRGRVWCELGAVQTLVNQSADPQDGIRFCRVVDGARNKGECYRVVGEMMISMIQAPEARGRSCQSAEAEFVSACLRAAEAAPAATARDE
ncbi:hypothetical protein [Longimicrobium sp.]|uniref:hypothetical protein n=1 Tax=Longimicrobium sp. TaxID=2029185 RepID=UPI002E32B279|nr:hypothetical protein [Longimicrobium sp.]HEX6038984.1 hypothetical protein [Longimicrobium sp.]